MEEEINDIPRWWTGCGQSSAGTHIIFILYIIIFVVGITGNTLSIILLLSRRGRKIMSEAFRIYIVALAISDNGLLLFNALLRYTVLPWFYDTNMQSWYELHACKFHRFFMHFFHNAAVWLLVVTTVDRFLAVCFPLVYRTFNHNSKHAKQVTTVAILLSLLFASPFLLVGPVYEDHDDHSIVITVNRTPQNISSTTLNASDFARRSEIAGCSMLSVLPEHIAYPINVAFHVTVGILIPYFVLISLNLIILYRIHFSRRLVNSLAKKQRLGRKITVMMVTVCLVFVGLWFPQVVMLFLNSDAHTSPCEINVYLSAAATLLALSNSALNFFLYCMTMKRFRKGALNLLLCRGHPRRESEVFQSNIVSDTLRIFWTKKTYRGDVKIKEERDNCDTNSSGHSNNNNNNSHPTEGIKASFIT